MKKISFKKILLLIRNNYSVNRSLPMILALAIAILGGIVGAMPISDLEARYAMRLEAGFATYEDYHANVRQLFDEMLGMDGVFSIMYMVVVFALAFFSVIALTGYMREKSGNDFYHSMAVTRGEIYIANYLTAFINTAATVLISQVIGLFFLNLLAKYPTYTFGKTLLMQLPALGTALLYLALFIAVAMLAAILSGTIFSTLISFAFINFYIPATVLATAASGNVLFNSSLMDYLDHRPHVYFYSSPYIRYIVGTAGDELPFTVTSFVLLALGTLFMIGLGILCYTKKKNENSSKPIAFSVLKRPLQYLLAFDVILLGATFFEAITDSIIWCFVGGVIALLFTFIFTNAFFDKTFTGVLKKSRHMAYILILTILLGVVFVADVFGMYKEPKIDVKNIESASIYVNINRENGHSSYDFNFEEEEEDWYSETVESISSESKKDIIDMWNFIKEKEKADVNVGGTVEIYEKYPDTESFLETISVSINVKCKNDFSKFYEHIYIGEGNDGYEELESLIQDLIDSYSHNLWTSSYETGEGENVEVIK